MAKILCQCGRILSDSTDNIPYKARFIADQDFFSFFDEVESECPHEEPTMTWRYFGDIFQCPDCNNLMVFSADYKRRCDFKPINKEESANITLSQVNDKKCSK